MLTFFQEIILPRNLFQFIMNFNKHFFYFFIFLFLYLSFHQIHQDVPVLLRMRVVCVMGCFMDGHPEEQYTIE